MQDGAPPYQVIGARCGFAADGQGDTKARDYTPSEEDKITFDGTVTFKDLKLNKVVSIINGIGLSPLLCFGNSSGDTAMAEYVLRHGGKDCRCQFSCRLSLSSSRPLDKRLLIVPSGICKMDLISLTVNSSI